MSDTLERQQNRWLVVIAAIILNLALGALYSWPVFSNYLEKALAEPERWKHLQTQLVFSMSTVFMAVGVIAAGQLSEKYPPRTLILISAVTTGSGYILGGILPLEPVTLTATIGVMVGFGIGMAYSLPINLAARWFPDRKGLATGLSMAGFGTGSVFWSQVFDLFLDDHLGISFTFIIYGVIFTVLILLTMKFLRDPPPGYRDALAARLALKGESAAASAGKAVPSLAANPQEGGFSRMEIAAQRQLYYLVFTFMAGSAIGLMIIGMSKSYPIERLMSAGYSARAAASVTSFAALIIFPIFNGSGRIIFGWLSDRLGWKPVMLASYGLQSLMLFFFPWLMSVPVMVFATMILLAMCYGGNFTIFPFATGQLWGSTHLAANYSLVFIAFGVGALIGPPLSGMAKDAGHITTAFIVAGALLACGVLMIAMLKKPRRRDATRSLAASGDA